MGCKNKKQIFLSIKNLNYWSLLKDFLFPKRCVGCGLIDTFLCDGCQNLLVRYSIKRCLFCGNITDNKTCKKCVKGLGKTSGFAYCYYKEGPAREIIKHFKFEGKWEVGIILGKLMAELIRENFLKNKSRDNFLIVPVPLDKTRLKERGYNQSLIMAREIGHKLNIQVSQVLIKNKRPPQLGLNKTQRKENIKNAFSCNKELSSKKIILVDDVLTTGSTIKESIYTLKRAGATKFCIVVFAKD